MSSDRLSVFAVDLRGNLGLPRSRTDEELNSASLVGRGDTDNGSCNADPLAFLGGGAGILIGFRVELPVVGLMRIYSLISGLFRHF